MSVIVIYAVILLTITWVILLEAVTIPVIVSGIVLSIGCIYISYRLLPSQKIKNVKLFRLTIYLFYLFGQIYLAAFKLIKLIIKGADVQVISVKTSITNRFLKTLLANSITLVPGTVSLELKDDTITILWLTKKAQDFEDVEAEGRQVVGNLERKLIKMQK